MYALSTRSWWTTQIYLTTSNHIAPQRLPLGTSCDEESKGKKLSAPNSELPSTSPTYSSIVASDSGAKLIMVLLSV